MGAARLDRGCGRSLGVAWRAVKRFAEARRKATGRGRVGDPEGAAGAGREERGGVRRKERAIATCRPPVVYSWQDGTTNALASGSHLHTGRQRAAVGLLERWSIRGVRRF